LLIIKQIKSALSVLSAFKNTFETISRQRGRGCTQLLSRCRWGKHGVCQASPLRGERGAISRGTRGLWRL